jgi:peptidoglycan hydrolase-like protein with peptidoglycan-binding domain
MKDDLLLEAEIRDLDRFFLPENGAPALAPGMQGQACANLRHALSMLGYDTGFALDYDAQTVEAVRQFQTDKGHDHKDGHCGKGTRSLLIGTLLKEARGFFDRAQDPEQRAVGHVFLSYASNDQKLVQDYETLIAGWGFTPWRDQHSIPGGADWNAEIEAQIESAYLLIAFATPHFLQSAMCRVEVQRALALGKPVLLIEHAPLPNGHWLEPVARSKQWIADPPKQLRRAAAAAFRHQLRQAIREAQRRRNLSPSM